MAVKDYGFDGGYESCGREPLCEAMVAVWERRMLGFPAYWVEIEGQAMLRRTGPSLSL